MGGSAGLTAGGGAAAARTGGTNDGSLKHVERFVLAMAPNLSCTLCSEPSDGRFER